jgi:hypothetical protein
LKKILVILLTLLVFIQPLSKVWIFVSFKINQDYIAKNLCENRAKPILKCNGKCQLMKKLKQADKDEEKQTPQTIKEKLEVLYCHNQANFNVSQKLDFEIKKQSFFGYKFQNYSSYQSIIFRPPIFNLI